MEQLKLYELSQPFDYGYLQVSQVHIIYYEQIGNPKGKPILFIHGGPGSGMSDFNKRLFDPKVYRGIFFDQRGCGKSCPLAELAENTTWDLVEDIETLRKFFEIDKWIVCGGSWGVTLGLLYGQLYPSHVLAFILRGIWLNRPTEIKWLYQEGGASKIFPEAWKDFIAPIPEKERHDMLSAYYKRLTGNNEMDKLEYATTFAIWEMSTYRLTPRENELREELFDPNILVYSTLECHYFTNNSFLTSSNQILENINRIKHIPCTIINGRYDIVCPVQTAIELHEAWPSSELKIPIEGHAGDSPGTVKELLKAIDNYVAI